MLKLTIPATELYNELTGEFIEIPETTLQLEHSLISLSKWESKWKKPFLDDQSTRTYEEMIDYIRCMTLTQNVNPDVYLGIKGSLMREVRDYIDDRMTATWISEEARKKMRAKNRKVLKPEKEAITSELIYYWMISLQIPFECQKWHINRLLTLIEVCNMKGEAPTKIPQQEQIRNYAALNAARKKKHHTRG